MTSHEQGLIGFVNYCLKPADESISCSQYYEFLSEVAEEVVNYEGHEVSIPIKTDESSIEIGEKHMPFYNEQKMLEERIAESAKRLSEIENELRAV